MWLVGTGRPRTYVGGGDAPRWGDAPGAFMLYEYSLPVRRVDLLR